MARRNRANVQRTCVHLAIFVAALFLLYTVFIRSDSKIAPVRYSRTSSRFNADGWPISTSLDKIEPVRNSNDDSRHRLADAEQLAKDNANKKAASREAVADSTDAQRASKQYQGDIKELSDDRREPANPNFEIAQGGNRKLRGKEADVKTKSPAEIEEDAAVEDVLNDILKMAPSKYFSLASLVSIILTCIVIVFSKSYCPYSKKAKHILFDIYNIEPPPYVVELDKHEMGTSIQARLADITHRSTVPNVLIRGRSIGGGDDVAALYEAGKLEEKIRECGGKQIMKMVQVADS